MAAKLCSAQSRLCFISSEHKKPLVRQHGSLRYIDYDISMLYLTAIDSTIRSTEIIRSYSYSEVIAPHILAFENVSFHGHLYRPQTKLRKGNVFTPVCKSFWSQGGVSQHAWGKTHSLGRQPLGKHPPADTPPAQCMLGYTPSLPSAWLEYMPPPPPAATAADGTHPSGMHSCITCF